MKYKYCIIILLLMKSVFSYSQAVPPGTELQELVKISEVYANITNLNFDVRYTFADSLTWEVFTDSMTATCKISYGRSFLSNSEIEVLKGSEYNVFVDKEDSIIIISRRNDYASIFQLPLLDSVFREAHVVGMNIAVIDDSTWQFTATFVPDSYFSYYEMLYNPQNGLISYINYHTRNESGDHEVPEDHIVCASIYMTNYSDVVQAPVLFNENRYFYLLNGTTFLQAAWQQYHFQN